MICKSKKETFKLIERKGVMNLKQYMVLVSMVVLGIFIFEIIAGDDPNSIVNSMANLWEKGLEVRTYTP